MTLPIKTTVDDIRDVCRYLSTKPTGATIKDAKSVLDSKRLDGRKLTAMKFWGLIEDSDGDKLKLSEAGRKLVKGGDSETAVLLAVVRKVPAYSAIVERAAHRHEDSLDTTEVGAHWHSHFKDDVGDTDSTIKDRAVCFFNLAAGAGLGTVIAGRRGNATRFSFYTDALARFIAETGNTPVFAPEPNDAGDNSEDDDTAGDESAEGTGDLSPPPPTTNQNPGASSVDKELGQGIFIAHGKNKKPLQQLKKILDQFHIPYKVAVDEPNLGRPISGKVREIMHSCNCAILIFTADEEFQDKDGNTIWRPSENVVYELGATGYLYDSRLVILKEDTVTFPSNFSDVGYISFEHDQLEAKAMDVLAELIGFGIVKLST